MTDLIRSIASIRADLAEARRYVTTHPDLVVSELTRLAEVIGIAFETMDQVEAATIADFEVGIEVRFGCNLDVAARDILACPDMTRGYIDATLWELAWVVGRLEKARPRAAGDVKAEA